MATIKPFKGLRYNQKKIPLLKEVICPPYDIIPENEIEKYLEVNPYNVIALERPVGENPYETAATILSNMKEKEILVHDNDSMYIYEERFEIFGETKSIKGIICAVRLEEFSKRIILPHEETLSKAKEDRFELMKHTYCNFSQVYSLYADKGYETREYIDSLSRIMPEVDITDKDRVNHRLWKISDKKVIEKLRNDFENRELFIADGHHRYETVLNFKKYCYENNLQDKVPSCDYIMMFLVDIEDKGLVVFPTHRIIKNINKTALTKIKKECEKLFSYQTIESKSLLKEALKKKYDEGKTAFALCTPDDDFLVMTLKDSVDLKKLISGVSESVRNLDVTVLHSLVLNNVLGIDSKSLSEQTNLEYTRDFDEAISLVKSKKYQASFIINPTKVSQISNVAKDFEKMPQKSTYFYPKIITGLVIHDLLEK